MLMLVGSMALTADVDAVLISTDVPPNPSSTLNKQLQEKEADLLKKEIELNRKQELTPGQLFIGGGILFGLVLLNFYLDYRHRKNGKNED